MMTAPLDIRLQLHRNGYAPLPLIGKRPVLKNWQHSTAREIELWPSLYPYATNTGVLTQTTPTLDLDILNEEAANAAEEIVRARYGPVLVRIGRPPKRAIPFRTDAPFKKLSVDFGKERIEFLCDGQQTVVAGTHPDTGQPYRWHGDALCQVPRQNLPAIDEAEARALVNEIVHLLCREHGYQRPKTAENHVGIGLSKNPIPNTHAISLVSIVCQSGDRFVPDRLHRKIIELMRGALPRHQRRVRGALRPLVEAREGRRAALFSAAGQFHDLIGEGIITPDDAEDLLFLSAQLNGYVEKRGEDHVRSTIKAGLKIPETRDMAGWGFFTQ